MLEAPVKVVNRLGLHARAAAQLVKLSGRFKSKILLRRPDNNFEADTRSILSVLALAAAMGTTLTLVVSGGDETAAFDAVVQLFESKFGEDQ